MKRVLIILVLSVALGVLGYMYFNLKEVSAGGPKFVTTDHYESTLQTSIDVVYRDIDIVKEDINSINDRLDNIEKALGL